MSEFVLKAAVPEMPAVVFERPVTSFKAMPTVTAYLVKEMLCAMMTFCMIIMPTCACKNDLLPCVGFQDASRGGGGDCHSHGNCGHLNFMPKFHNTLLTCLLIKIRMKQLGHVSTNRCSNTRVVGVMLPKHQKYGSSPLC